MGLFCLQSKHICTLRQFQYSTSDEDVVGGRWYIHLVCGIRLQFLEDLLLLLHRSETLSIEVLNSHDCDYLQYVAGSSEYVV